MCGGIHYGEAEGLVSVERWSCSRSASCVAEHTMGRLTDAGCSCRVVSLVLCSPIRSCTASNQRGPRL